uniref:Uncharacterized protein LOC100184277 n=1 Tax=Phallusia mammillata TaxID=59560 RepID=A0A6F9DHG9_9ASCI|nr:uncharacterized protein LOC100184277 [Phallusia mammillata]
MTTLQAPIQQPGMMIQVPVSAVVNSNEKRLAHCKKVLLGLGVTEFLLGLFSTLLGIVALAYSYDDRITSSYYNETFYMGQGLWCGVWVIVAGLLGILSGRKHATQCMINSHMSLSIVASIFSAVMFSIAIPMSLILRFRSSRSIFLHNIEIVLAVFGFVTFILCIVSATYCCYTLSAAGHVSCCSSCCDCCAYNNQTRPEGQAVYVVQSMNPNQQFVPVNTVMVPGSSQIQTVPVSTSAVSQQNAYTAVQSKEAESQAFAIPLSGATEQAPPPAYDY